jgi:hypothetical protein
VTAASRAPTGRSNMPTTAVGGSAGCVITRASSAAGLGSSTGAVGVGAGMAASSLDRCGTGGRGGATGSRAALGLGGAIVASRWMCGVMSESGGGVNLIAVAVLMKVIDWCRGAGVEVTRAPTPTITTIAARCTPALATIPVFGRRSRGAAANSRSMQRDTLGQGCCHDRAPRTRGGWQRAANREVGFGGGLQISKSRTGFQHARVASSA